MTQPTFAKVAAAPAPDYFALFGLPRSFALDLADLERRYLERSKQVHPDRFVDRPAAERIAATSQSMETNRAYKALRKPVSRAEHLLNLHGLAIGDQERLEPQFLMEVLEAREELADAKMAGDSSALARLRGDMERRESASLAAIAAGFERFDTDGDRAALGEVKRQLILMRYIQRYLEAFDDDEG